MGTSRLEYVVESPGSQVEEEGTARQVSLESIEHEEYLLHE